ncbi:hypothetical protein Tco_0139439 [Tanacetum coccineum]
MIGDCPSDGRKEFIDEFGNRSSEVRIERGVLFVPNDRTAPVNENGKSISLIVELAQPCILIDGKLFCSKPTNVIMRLSYSRPHELDPNSIIIIRLCLARNAQARMVEPQLPLHNPRWCTDHSAIGNLERIHRIYGDSFKEKKFIDVYSVKTEFPAIVFNNSLTLNETPSCEPTVSSLNDEIDFRISFDESDDEDYMIVFDKNSFSYKIISTNDLKTDLGNDNEKVNKPLFLTPDPLVSCINDLEFFIDFENEFPTIVYNDALTSKSNFSTEPTLCPQHIDKFYLKDETSLSKDDEVEQSILYFNDLLPFKIVYPDDLKSDKGNDDNEIDIIQSSRDNENTNNLLKESHDKIRKIFIMGSFIMGLNVNIVAWNHFVNGMLFNLIKNLYMPFSILFDPKWYYKDGDCARMLRRPRAIRHMAPLPPRDQRHLWLCYQVVGYIEEIVHDFEQRLEMIFGKQVNRVHLLDFEGLTLDMRHDLAERMRMVYTGDDGQEVFVSHAWRRLFGIQAPLVQEFILEFYSTCMIGDEMGLDVVGLHTAEEMAEDIFGAYWLGSERLIPDKGDLSDY